MKMSAQECVPEQLTEETVSDNEVETQEQGPFKLCGYIFGTYSDTLIPVHYLSVFIKYLLPSDYLADHFLKATIKTEVLESVHNWKSAACRGTGGSRVVRSGSRAECLHCPEHLLKDNLPPVEIATTQRILVYANTIETEGVQKGNAENIDIEESKLKEAVDILEVMEGGELPQNCCQVRFAQEFSKLHNSESKVGIGKLHAVLLGRTQVPMERKCDLVTLCQFIMQHSSDDFDIDYEEGASNRCVEAVHINAWPSNATEWLSRQRLKSWPPEDCLENIKQGGYHIIPIDDDEHASLWVCSFFKAESILSGILTTNQRKCFVLLQLLFEHSISGHYTFKYYHLKTFFYWICEYMPVHDFCDVSFGATFLTVLSTLRDCIRARNLDHYFIRSMNLLEDMPPGESEALARDIEVLMGSIVETILALDRKITFTGPLLQREKLGVAFASALHACRASCMEETIFVASVQDGLRDLLRSYLHCFAQTRLGGGAIDSDRCPAHQNVLIDLLRDLLVDMREFEDVPETVNNMDFMLGTLITARKDPETLAYVYMLLCLRAGLKDKEKMLDVLRGVGSRAPQLRSLSGAAQFVLQSMVEELRGVQVPEAALRSNKGIYMQQCNQRLVTDMLSGLDIEEQ